MAEKPLSHRFTRLARLCLITPLAGLSALVWVLTACSSPTGVAQPIAQPVALSQPLGWARPGAYSPPVPPPTYPRPTITYSRPAPTYSQPAPTFTHPVPTYSHPAPSQPHVVPVRPVPAPSYRHPSAVRPEPIPVHPPNEAAPAHGHPAREPIHPRPVPVSTPPTPTPTPTPLPVRPSPLPPPAPWRLVQIPRVLGMGLYQAEEVLQQNGLTVGTVGVRYSNETAGTVVQTTPGVGTAVPAGSRVDLVIALQQ